MSCNKPQKQLVLIAHLQLKIKEDYLHLEI